MVTAGAGVLSAFAGFGVLAGLFGLSAVSADFLAGESAVFEGDALGVGLERRLFGVRDGVAVAAGASAREARSRSEGVLDGVGSGAGSDSCPPHQEEATSRQPPGPSPLACAIAVAPTAPRATTTAAAMTAFRRPAPGRLAFEALRAFEAFLFRR
jgi:hypothetical protein